MKRLIVLLSLLVGLQSSAAPTKKSVAAAKRQARAMDKMRGDPETDRYNLNGKDTLSAVKKADGTRREVRASTGGDRIEVETRARNGQTYYHGFEGEHELIRHAFTVGKRSFLRQLDFKPGEEVEVTERRVDGKTTSKTARAVRDLGRSVHERSLLIDK
jgi:hypothetical protein